MRKRILALLFSVFILMSILPAAAFADDAAPAYERIMISEDDFELYTKSDYPWTGSSTYTSGNAGIKNSMSTLKLVANKTGLLKFDWTVSYVNRLAYFAYRVGNDYATGAEVTSQSEHKYGGEAMGTESGLLVNEGDVVYFTYYKINALSNNTTVDDEASISNVRIDDYIETDEGDFDSLLVYDESMGTVTAQLMETLKDPSGYDYTHLSDVDMADVAEGNSYRLKAVAKDGYQFYGWIQTYRYNGQIRTSYRGLKYYTLIEKQSKDENGNVTRITNDKQAIAVPELEINLDGNSQYTAVFAPTGAYIARANSTFYDNTHDLTEIINSAGSGDMIELLADATLSGDATVKKGVTFYVPFRAIMGADDEANGKYRKLGGTPNEFGQDTEYVTLTINSGTTLTIKGNLAIGAVSSATGQGMQGHVSGKYGQIANNGNIIICEKGTMVSYGLVTGSGVVRAENYGVVKEPLVICDFAGGSNTLALYTDQQMPFKRFATQNIQCELQLERYGTLTGLIDLHAASGFNEMEADVVGVTSQSIFLPNDTGTSGNSIVLSRTYSPEYLASDTKQSIGIGKTIWNVYGGLTFRNLTLNLGIATITMDHVDFAIPPHMDFFMHDGLYDIPGKVKIMPGSHMTVAEDATLKIDGKLIVLDGLKQNGMSGYFYPTREQLSVPGYGGSGEFVLNGTLRITEGSTLGGVIQSTSDTGLLIIEEGAYLKNSTADLSALDPDAAVDLDVSMARQTVPAADTWVTQTGEGNDLRFYNWVQQDGGKGGYADNTTWFNLPARIYNGTEMIPLTPGTWKSSVASHTFTDTSEQRYCTNGKSITAEAYTNGREMTVYNDTFERTVQGAWGESTSAVEITSNTVAGSATTGVSVDAITVRNDDGSTTLTLNTLDSEGAPVSVKYVHLVKYATASGTETAAKNADGTYTIPAEGLSVSIESAMLGDPNGDGRIAAADLLFLKQKMTGKRVFSELQELAVDINGNGRIDATDLLRVKQLLTGKLSQF